MPLERQIVRLNFGQGLDTLTDPRQVVPGKFLTLENAYWSHQGKLEKRNGYTPIWAPGAPPTLLSSFHGTKLIAASGKDVYAKSGSAALNVGVSDSSRLSVMPIPDTKSGGRDVRSMCCDGSHYAITFSDEYNGVLDEEALPLFGYELFDMNGSLLTQKTLSSEIKDSNGVSIGDVTSARIFALSTYFVVLITNTLGQVWALPLSRLNGAWSPPYQILSGTATSNPILQGTVILDRVVFVVRDAANGLIVGSIGSTIAHSTAQVATAEVYGKWATVFPVGDSFAVAWFSNARTSVLYTLYDLNLNQAASATPPKVLASTGSNTLYGICGATINSTSYVWWTEGVASALDSVDTTPVGPTRGASFTAAGGPTGTTGTIFDRLVIGPTAAVVTSSRDGQVGYVTSVYLGGAQGSEPTIYIHRLDGFTSTVSAKLAQGLAYTTAFDASGVYYPTATSMVLPYTATVRTAVGHESYSITFRSMNLAMLSIDQQLQSVEFGGSLCIAAGTLKICDGANVVDQGWHYPDVITATEGGLSGSLEAGKQYQYTYTYEWLDANGNLHRSAPCPNVEAATIVSTGKEVGVKGQVPGWGMGSSQYRSVAKPATSYIVVYRTCGNQQIFRRIATLDASLYTSETWLYLDTASDDSILDNEQLYTTGAPGEVENIACPAPKVLGKYLNRLIVVPVEDPYSWWYSKESVPGYGPEFNDFFVQHVDHSGGPLTAVAQLDDKLLLFKQEAGIYAVTGQGPAPNGTANDFSPPVLITTDSGCTEPFSVVRFPNGVIFKSAKGIMMIDRSLQVSYIGGPVAAFNGYTILSATLLEDIRQIRFVLSNNQVLVYDYLYDQWSVFKGSGFLPVRACLSPDAAGTPRYTYVASNGATLRETPGTYTDSSQPYAVKMVTSWLSFAGIIGFERVRRFILLGDYTVPGYGDPTTLTIGLCYDFQQEVVTNSIVLAPTVTTSPYQMRIHMPRQKMETLQIVFTESAYSYGAGFSFSALAFEVGTKKGVFKMPASSSTG